MLQHFGDDALYNSMFYLFTYTCL